jgi:CMP-N,N'-diacetyllegionaminic acid synthase
MNSVPRTAAIIPIRSADPETPPTGMVTLSGRPLLAYTIDEARRSKYVERVLVSTDDSRVAALARTLGADAPFLRPAELAEAVTPLGAVLQHAVNWLDSEGSDPIEIFVLLEITHPVRPAGLIDKVIEVVLTEGLDSAFSAREERHKFWAFDPHGNLNRVRPMEESPHDETPRSDLHPLYKEMGGLVTVLRADVARRGRRLGESVGVVPVRELSSLVDLRDEDGQRLAELLLASDSE